jgi:DNA-binding NarL/FixJ family response regulator
LRGDEVPVRDTASSSGSTITVLLADDHDILRDGLKALLSMAGDIEVVGEARTGREAVEKSELLAPDVILMDISMPELDGVEACRRIRAQVPESHVLFLTMHEAEEYFFRALQVGASGYVIKRTAAADLLAAVRAVAHGESFLSPSMARALLDDYAERDVHHSSSSASLSDSAGATSTADNYATLTSREREILQLVGEGHTNQEIADRLHVSVKTVQSHRAAVMAKLRLRDVTHLVRYAVRRGLVDPER